MEHLVRDFEYEEVIHFYIGDHMLSPEDKHRFKNALALACRNIAQSVIDVVGSLPYVISKLDTLHADCS